MCNIKYKRTLLYQQEKTVIITAIVQRYYDRKCICNCDWKNMPKKNLPKNNIYSGYDLDTSIQLYNVGKNLNKAFIMFPNIPRKTITERIKNSKEEGVILQTVPKPIITNKMEEYFQSWIIVMQRNGVPVLRDMILWKRVLTYLGQQSKYLLGVKVKRK